MNHDPAAQQTDPTQRIYGMARQMGPACARGYMHPSHAFAAIAVAACRASREAPRFRIAPTIAGAHKVLKESAREFAIKMDATRKAIREDATDRIERNDPVPAIRAAAHNINGSAGFPLAEHQVEAAVRSAAEAIARMRAEAPHGR